MAGDPLSLLGSLKAARMRLAAFRAACASGAVWIWGFTANFMRKSMAAVQSLLSEAISSCALWRKTHASRPCADVRASASCNANLDKPCSSRQERGSHAPHRPRMLPQAVHFWGSSSLCLHAVLFPAAIQVYLGRAWRTRMSGHAQALSLAGLCNSLRAMWSATGLLQRDSTCDL